MTPTAVKDFGPIREDYAFFEAHSDEAEADLARYRAPAAALLRARGEGPFRLLDFGCGAGAFSARFLAGLGCPPERLELTLVEPEPRALGAAARALAGFSASPLAAHPALPAGGIGPFDLVLANHSLYYVEALEALVPRLLGALAPGGVLLAAFAGRENALVGMWEAGFGWLGEPVPYNTAERLDALLAARGLAAEGRLARYRLRFPDCETNRWRVLRFLFAEHAGRLPAGRALALFEPHARAGFIELPVAHRHFVLRG